MSLFHPRLTIAALRGGSGKTILSLGLVSAWKARGHKIAVFKKGPDFIDSGWLSFAAGSPCYNLDPFLMTREQMLHSFAVHSATADISIIEGNRGLYDGLDLDGCCSTAELGKMLRSPVILIADVTMTTRTVAALVLGCQKFDPDLKIAGVILNRVAGSRQESVVRGAIEQHCGVPVVGAIPKLKETLFPERHMGLIPHLERTLAEKAVDWARNIVEKNLDLDSLWKIAGDVEPLSNGAGCPRPGFHLDQPLRVGVIRDRSFWFYYPENLEHLKSLGAALVEIDSLQGKILPQIDALYIGGGFPETQAEALAENKGFRNALKEAIEQNLPVYAECGGLMYLGERLLVGEKSYPMVGALPLSFILEEKPQGHGYTVMEVDGENPYYPVGEVLKGHEFHYSRVLTERGSELKTIFKVRRGRGLDGRRDGILHRNLLATYTHLHAGGTSLWGEGLLRAALASRGRKLTA
ncbi:MAG: cobyrinic acid a,c-diamide synthase [Deltaproteobacteria bacterium HGW-Deltaproteobacteria-21]|nr:MAG: cobyrinic acid a,c-diamide synthase [Deltaproteobacteria bacterium HGW-Deltaproteobacteria-21]